MAAFRSRVCLIGPECTGKTTLAERLARAFDAPWVAEYVRDYAARVDRPITAEDVDEIAKGQMALEDAAVAAARSGDLILLDTDLLSTVTYSRYYYGACPAWIEAEAAKRKADLYLLMEVDIPWTPDAVRDSAAGRAGLRRDFESVLGEFAAEFVTISGDFDARFAAADQAIRQRGSRRDPPPAAGRILPR